MIIRSLLTILLLVALVSGCSAETSKPENLRVSDSSEDITVIAHRGANGYLPESTIPAFTMALCKARIILNLILS